MLECRLDSCGLEHGPGAASREHSRKCLSIVATINFSRGTDDDNDRHHQCQRKKEYLVQIYLYVPTQKLHLGTQRLTGYVTA
jgi:hypothetical protein